MWTSTRFASRPVRPTRTADPRTGARTSAPRRCARPSRGLALIGLGLALAAGVVGSGCESSCDALAEQICACKPNQSEESACIQAVQVAQQTKTPSDAELAVCEQRLDTCTCAALEDHNVVACGLGKPR